MKAFLREILGTLILALVIFLILQATVQSFKIFGTCMEPSLHHRQRLLINKVVYHFHEPERGDVVVFHSPNDPKAKYIKRIIALPGETIEVKDGVVYVNGSHLNEPYIKEPPSYTVHKQKIPVNEYFVLGDNRNNSDDSHNWGTLHRQEIIGKAWLSLWPPGQWGIVAKDSLQEQLASGVSK